MRNFSGSIAALSLMLAFVVPSAAQAIFPTDALVSTCVGGGSESCNGAADGFVEVLDEADLGVEQFNENITNAVVALGGAVQVLPQELINKPAGQRTAEETEVIRLADERNSRLAEAIRRLALRVAEGEQRDRILQIADATQIASGQTQTASIQASAN